MLGENLFRFSRKPYIVLDTETESLNLLNSRPWQIGFLVIENKKVVETIDMHVFWDDLNISKDAARITKFNLQEYKHKAKPAEECWDILKNYLYNDYFIVGQNLLNFDIYQIKSLQKAVTGTYDYDYLTKCFDTVALGRANKAGERKIASGENILAWQYRWMNNRGKHLKASLPVLCRDLDIPYEADQHHNAIYDVIKTHEIFEKLIQLVEI